MAKETNKTPEELAAEAAAKKAAEVKAKAEAEAKEKAEAEAKAKEEAEAKKKEAELKTVTIVKSFRDKNDHKTWYSIGSVREFEASRAKDMVTRGFAKFVEV